VLALLWRMDRAAELLQQVDAVVQLGALRIDPDRREVSVDGESVHLTPTEFDLLGCLARRPGAVHLRGELLREVWGWTDASGTRTVDSHVRCARSSAPVWFARCTGWATPWRPAREAAGPHPLDQDEARCAGQVERRGGSIPVGGLLRRISCADGLLVGDAAGAVSPLTAGGLDPCLRLSEHAVAVLDDALRTGQAEMLSHYDGAALRARFRGRLLLRRGLAQVRTPAVAAAAFQLLRTPPGRAAAHRILFGDGSFPAPRPAPSTLVR
jgi:Transcriptional regulatory protein, C terminal